MKKPTIATLAGHSALEIFAGAKKHGFETLAVAQKGREKTYTKYFHNLIDENVLVESFSQLISPRVIQILKKQDCIFIPHRYIQVYTDLNKFENNFNVPVFGNRCLLKYEEREGKYSQYQILKNAGVNYPVQFENPEEIDRLVIVKVREKDRNYERGFFFAKSHHEFRLQAAKNIKKGIIKRSDLQSAVIEEYLVGVQVNFNFFHSILNNRLELLGIDTRRQTNIDGLIRLPAGEQMEYLKYSHPSYIESGHIAATVKESLLEAAFLSAEKILAAAKKINPPGIIGPFALQTIITAGPPKEKIVVFDLSFRIPGSPGTSFTPYSGYLFGQNMSFGERIALEIKEAIKIGKINTLIT